jgi:ATP-dependent Clp protease ATP-binding subunit ClpC
VAACPSTSRESWSPEAQSPWFSGEFKRALGYARDESARLGHGHVGTEHLLLGIIRESANRAAALLALEMGVGLGGLRSALETYARPSASDATADGTAGNVPWTPRASEAVWSAVAEARSLAAPETGPEHLLLALLRDTRSTASQVLASWSVTYAAALAKVHPATEDAAA